MRALLCFAMVLGSTSAWADKKTQAMIPGLERESTTCQTQMSGISKIATKATALATTLEGAERSELEADTAKLTAGLASLQIYCDEVSGLVAFLKDKAAASYKSVEKELDERDNKVRKLRKDSKKTLDELNPITRKLIPRIAKAPTPVIEDKRTPGKFPSGRVIELPALGGTWKLSGTAASDTAEYADKTAAATVTTRPFTGATCEQQKRALKAELADAPVTSKVGAIAWSVRYLDKRSGGTHLVAVICATSKTGGWLATADLVPAAPPAVMDELTKVMVRMLDAQSSSR